MSSNAAALPLPTPQTPPVGARPHVRQAPLVSALAVVAVALMAAAYFLPLWWVSLTAPNYPPDAFPDGIRIFFSFRGVTNGCTSAPKASRLVKETQQEDLGWRDESGAIDEQPAAKPDAVLDCMHEMNTINHYVGMHPIGVGAPVERLMSKFLLAFLALCLIGFAIGAPRPRLVVLGVGFAGVAGWMLVELFAQGGLTAYVDEYMTEAGKYFREPERIAAWGKNLRTAVLLVTGGLVVVMAATVAASARWPRFQLALAIVPALLPVFFVVAFAGWLYFFGHNLHPWGAFTVKPFMPTVFGDGKVAQFSTHSYPLPGFALLVGVTLASLMAALRRRLELLDGGS